VCIKHVCSRNVIRHTLSMHNQMVCMQGGALYQAPGVEFQQFAPANAGFKGRKGELQPHSSEVHLLPIKQIVYAPLIHSLPQLQGLTFSARPQIAQK